MQKNFLDLDSSLENYYTEKGQLKQRRKPPEKKKGKEKKGKVTCTTSEFP